MKFQITKIKLLKTSIILLLIFATICGIYSYNNRRFTHPKSDHVHIRLQYVFRGKAENFGDPRYQIDYLKDVCDGELTESPIHFHDNKDQIVHLHWQDMKGGDILKFYGINETIGLDNIMGIKLDKLLTIKPQITTIPIHSNSLPKPAGNDKYFVYIGDKDSYQQKEFGDFLTQPLEEFLNKKSSIREQREELERFENSNSFMAIKALAHAGETHETLSEEQQHELDVQKEQAEKKLIEDRNNSISEPVSASTNNPNIENKTEEELKQINNLIGNVVIFVQPEAPSNEQIKARFDNLEPLGLSSCGG
jgi:hypothetical protein